MSLDGSTACPLGMVLLSGIKNLLFPNTIRLMLCPVGHLARFAAVVRPLAARALLKASGAAVPLSTPPAGALDRQTVRHVGCDARAVWAGVRNGPRHTGGVALVEVHGGAKDVIPSIGGDEVPFVALHGRASDAVYQRYHDEFVHLGVYSRDFNHIRIIKKRIERRKVVNLDHHAADLRQRH